MAVITYGQDTSQPNYKITETPSAGPLTQAVQVSIDFTKCPTKSLAISALQQIIAHLAVAVTPI